MSNRNQYNHSPPLKGLNVVASANVFAGGIVANGIGCATSGTATVLFEGDTATTDIYLAAGVWHSGRYTKITAAAATGLYIGYNPE